MAQISFLFFSLSFWLELNFPLRSELKMLSLLCGAWQYWTSVVEYNVVIVGLDDAGKTTFLQSAKEVFEIGRALAPEQIAPTIGVNLLSVPVESSGGVHLLLHDLGGQKSLRRLWTRHLNEAQGIIFVVDASSSAERLAEARDTFQQLVRPSCSSSSSSSPSISAALPADLPILIVANKQDRPNARSHDEIARFFAIGELTGQPILVESASFLRGQGVRRAIEWIAENIVVSQHVGGA